MRWLIPLLLLTSTARAETVVPDAARPGEQEFLGCHKYPDDKRFRWGVRGEVGVPELVASLGEISCLAIVVGPQVSSRAGKVMIEVPDLLTTVEVYRLFYSALEALGLTVEKAGKTLKIVDAGRAKEVSQPSLSGPAPTGDQFVTRLYRVEHAGVAELAETLSRMRGKEGEVTPYAAGQSIILTDRATNVRRMEELARALDVAPPGQRIFTVVAHAQPPSELASTVEKILQAGRKPNDKGVPPGDGVAAVVPIDTAHLLAVVATDAGWRRVSSLLARIDPPIPDEELQGAQAHVLYLANTNAEDMATTLQSVGLSSRGVGGSKPGALALQGEVRIGADKVSNSLVVFAGGNDFLMVRDLVGKLDVPRRQVYVEATILDVSVDKIRNLGIVFHNGASVDGNTAFVASGSQGFNSVVVNAQTVGSALGTGGLVAGLLGKSFSFAGTSVPSLGVMLQALEHSKDVNVLSRPHLLTMDNTKASLSVGQSIPFQTQSLATPTGGTTAMISNYARTDVTLKMEITPHLNDSDSVRLELDGTIEDVPDGQTLNQAGGPTTNKRTLKTAVVVRDGDTIVLGGLQKESESESVEKIPGLGDIPLLGRLFQYRSKQRSKQDLLIILTPYVIRGPEDLRQIFEQRAAERREFIERCTAFQDDSVYDAHVDYRRKRGLLEEINVAAREAEQQAQAMRAASQALRKAATRREGVIEDDGT
jgi:general secretion pathway protein D